MVYTMSRKRASHEKAKAQITLISARFVICGLSCLQEWQQF